jgi:hypothetical protein
MAPKDQESPLEPVVREGETQVSKTRTFTAKMGSKNGTIVVVVLIVHH